MKKILIIEDNQNDLQFYLPLFALPETEVSLLFLTRNKDFTKEKLETLMSMAYETLAPKIRKYHVCTEATIRDFLKANVYDFYIADSLGGTSDACVGDARLPKDRVAFLSSTTDFRNMVSEKGYRAYKKEDIGELIADCLK